MSRRRRQAVGLNGFEPVPVWASWSPEQRIVGVRERVLREQDIPAGSVLSEETLEQIRAGQLRFRQRLAPSRRAPNFGATRKKLTPSDVRRRLRRLELLQHYDRMFEG